jgi:hypothetical protein
MRIQSGENYRAMTSGKERAEPFSAFCHNNSKFGIGNRQATIELGEVNTPFSQATQ